MPSPTDKKRANRIQGFTEMSEMNKTVERNSDHCSPNFVVGCLAPFNTLGIIVALSSVASLNSSHYNM